MLPDTAAQMARKLGLPFRPDLLQSNDPVAIDYQRRLGAAYLQEGLQRTGNVRDALRYYHGGPNRSIWGPKTNAYADTILGRLGGS
jgi:soluble lytic murein transglycosylase-like protein